MVFKVINHERVPKFNSPVFLENKTAIGIIDEIFGPTNEVVRLFIILELRIEQHNSRISDFFYSSPVLHCQAQGWLQRLFF